MRQTPGIASMVHNQPTFLQTVGSIAANGKERVIADKEILYTIFDKERMRYGWYILVLMLAAAA